MEPIRDLSWMAQLSGGRILERFSLYGYAATALHLGGGTEGGKGTYRYRILFAQPGERRPVYAVNLESSLLGAWLLTEQEGSAHRVVSHLEAPPDYDDFRILALERAAARLVEVPVPSAGTTAPRDGSGK